MNSSSIVKRTLPLIIVLIVIIGIAVSCTIFSGTRGVPNLSNPKEVYSSYQFGENKVTVNNDKMYQTLKPQGLVTAVDWVDKTILSNEKNVNGTDQEKDRNFYDLALNDEEGLKKLKDEAIYGTEDEKKKLSDEDKDKKLEDYIKNMKIQGYKVNEADNELSNDEKEYFGVKLARQLYAYDRLAQDIKDQNKKAEDTKDLADDDKNKELPYFTDKDIQNYYESNYKDNYWAIVISYSSSIAVERALAQIGIKMSPSTSSSEGWKWVSNDTALTAAEILQAYVMLYNNANAYKDGGSRLVDENQFTFNNVTAQTVKDDKTTYKFDPTKAEDYKDCFYYTYDELNTLSSAVRNRVAGTSIGNFFDNQPTSTGKDATGYQKIAYTSSSKYFLILKLAIEEKTDLYTDSDDTLMNETIKAEIVEKLTENKKTEAFVKTKMNELRKSYNLAFYDDSLQSKYISSYDSAHEKTKKENKTAILKITVNGEDKFYSADDFFSKLSKLYGATYLLDLINREVVLSDTTANTVLSSYTPGMTYDQIKKNVKDKDKWNTILENVQNLKTNFAGNAFSQYGYASNYGWTNFIKDFYLSYYGILIESEEDLVTYFIYQDALQEYGKQLNDYASNTALQNVFEEKMTETRNDYFKASGYHLLISVNDEDGTTPVSPLVNDTKWTAEQKAAAQALYDDILTLIEQATDAQAALADFVTAYNAAPYNSLYEATSTNAFGAYNAASLQPTLEGNPYIYKGLAGNVSGLNINMSNYKSQGLSVKYEALSTFTNGKMVKEFEEVAKAIWKTQYEAGSIEYNNDTKAWTVENDKVVANKDVVKAATNNENEYLITEFGYHVYVQSGAEGYAGMTPSKDNSATGEEKNKYKEVRIPTVDEIKLYLEIINSDEYKAILNDSNYKSGDENKLFEIRDDNGTVTGYKLTEYQRLCITTYYTPIETELQGAYSISLKLMKQLKSNIGSIELNTNTFNKEHLEYVIDNHIDYNFEKLEYLNTYFTK